MTSGEQEAARSTRERLDLVAGLLSKALKHVAVKEAEPKRALGPVRCAMEILKVVVAEERERGRAP